MKTWLRTVLAVVTVSLPLAGCAAQTADGTDTQSLAPALAETPAAAKGALAKLTSVDAKFSQWLVSPSGKLTGMLLDDGSVAMVPHHAANGATAVTKETLQAGDAVHVEGFSHPGSQVFAFASVKKGDTTIFEAPRPPQGIARMAGISGMGRMHGKPGPDGKPAMQGIEGEKGQKGENGQKGQWREHAFDPQKAAEWRARREAKGADGEGEGKRAWKHEGKRHHEDLSNLAPATATGTVVALLPGRHGRPGDARAVVLSDGTVAYAKHARSDAKLGELVKKGDVISVSGKGGSYDLGKALVIESVKLPSGETKEI